jgi:hypothetical protein
MGKSQRVKGATGEREVLGLLSERLGQKFERNITQSRCGGADCIDMGRIRLEVKRQERLLVKDWWEQAQKQAKDGVPVLAYRQSRKPWTFVLDCADISLLDVRGHLIHMDMETFCLLVEKMNFLETTDDSN